jgi:hypothetical protein
VGKEKWRDRIVPLLQDEEKNPSLFFRELEKAKPVLELCVVKEKRPHPDLADADELPLDDAVEKMPHKTSLAEE